MTELDSNLTTYCGLYCGDCHGHSGTVADLARDLRKELRRYKYDKFAAAVPFKTFQHYSECYEVLGAMVKFRCRKACRGGGGPPLSARSGPAARRRDSRDAGSVVTSTNAESWPSLNPSMVMLTSRT